MKIKNYDDQAMYSQLLNFEPMSRREEEKRVMPKDPRTLYAAEPDFYPLQGAGVDDTGNAYIICQAAGANEIQIEFKVKEEKYLMEKMNKELFCFKVPDEIYGFQYVSFYANGVEIMNPLLPFGYGYGRICNYVELPGKDNFYMPSKVAHGSITLERYFSAETGRDRVCWVYTPAGYDKGTELYPVLYIQHGGGENESAWFWQGKLHFILDNLIASGECEKMIVVANTGYVYRNTENGRFGVADFSEVICKECIPFIDQKYRTIADRDHRAVAGLSMGAGQARHLAHGHAELFSYMGVFSSGAGFQIKGNMPGGTFDYSELFKTPKCYNSIMKLTFIACGDVDIRHAYTLGQVEDLRNEGYNVEYHTYPGDHEWNVWRLCIRDYLKKIFK